MVSALHGWHLSTQSKVTLIGLCEDLCACFKAQHGLHRADGAGSNLCAGCMLELSQPLVEHQCQQDRLNAQPSSLLPSLEHDVLP